MPHKSTMWGGLTICTSSPYALCHQSSNGAEVIMSRVPQMHTQAPRGPLKPQNFTVDALSAGVPKNVVLSTSHPQVSPVSEAPSCSSRWGRVQNVSRPTVRCQEMSQISPVTMNAEDSIRAANVMVRSETADLVLTAGAAWEIRVAIGSTLRERALVRQTHTH